MKYCLKTMCCKYCFGPRITNRVILCVFSCLIPWFLYFFLYLPSNTYELLLIIHNRWMAAQSVFYHLYNQVSYMSLDEISPLTFSIGNTMKRISVIVSSIIIFHTPVQPVNALGAAIAIFGTFLYSQVSPFSLWIVCDCSLFIYGFFAPWLEIFRHWWQISWVYHCLKSLNY